MTNTGTKRQLPAEPPQTCESCGEQMVEDAGVFRPLGRKDDVVIRDGRAYCPAGCN